MKNIHKILSLIIAVVFVMSFTHQLNATHIVGGDITYKCLGKNNVYELTLTVRRDCIHGSDDAPFDTPLYLTIFNGENQFMIRRGQEGYVFMEFLGQDTVEVDLPGNCITPGGRVCVHEAKYKGTVILPYEKSGYILAYQRCCRNQTLNNIIDPLETGSTYFTYISPNALELCNNSPEFNNWPPIYICSGKQLSFNHSATDDDGDQLVYELCTPSQGATIDEPKPTKTSAPPFATVLWKPPYSLQNMLGGDALIIDSNTGLITARPNLIGQFLVGICVKEYRGGVLIGETRRDFEFNVRPCGDKPEANFELLTDPCDGLEQSFKNTSVGGNDYTWFFDSENDRTKTSKDKNPTFKYDKPGTYVVVLIADDQQCVDSIFKVITIIDPNIKVDFEYDLACDNEVVLRLKDKSTANGLIVGWNWVVTEKAGSYLDSTKDVIFHLKEGGNITVKLIVRDTNGCLKTLLREIDLPTVELELIGDSISVCENQSIKILKNGNASYKYVWSPTTYLDLNPPHNPTARPLEDITYHVRVTNDTCSLEDSIFIMVNDTFPVVIIGEDTTCSGDVKLTAISDTTDIFVWSKDPDFNTIIGTSDMLIDKITSTTTYYVRAGKEDECKGIASFTVTYGELIITIQDEYILCDGGGMLVLNEGGNPDLVYSWSPGHYLDDSTKYNPKGNFTHSVEFKVNIYDPRFPQCAKDFTVNVRVSPIITISGLAIDTVLCDVDSIDLEIRTNIEGVKIEWCDENGKVIATGKKVRISTPDSAYVICKVTDDLDCVYRDSIFIRNYNLDIDILYPDEACIGDSIMLEVVNNGDEIKVTWVIRGEDYQQNKVTVMALSKDEMFQVRIDYGDGCIFEDTIEVTLLGFDSIQAIADPTRIELGRKVQLNVDATNADIYAWKPSRILNDPTIQDPIATPDSLGFIQFTIKVTDENGCMAWDTVSVEVIPLDCVNGVFLPNAFSPNGDKINDVLRVRSNVILDMELLIYDRWGEEVFHGTSQSDTWDGIHEGDGVGPDVYNYYLKYTCIDGSSLVKTGNINLIK